jgi:aerobic-type carbon monoxide dehydrogenase small subunit (CoxS/CutS family)
MILNVNGKSFEVQSGTRTVLEVLRDDLGLGGTKEGCGVGMCGACTILVDGKPISGCLTLAEQVVGKQILTVEGLAENGELHPVQQAFIDEMAFQCAYCTPGFILTTVALLNENQDPGDDEIREYLSGNLCRCGSYQNILSAVKRASRNRMGFGFVTRDHESAQ